MSDHPPSRTRLHCMVSILYAKQLIKHRYALGSLLMAYRSGLFVRTHALFGSLLGGCHIRMVGIAELQ